MLLPKNKSKQKQKYFETKYLNTLMLMWVMLDYQLQRPNCAVAKDKIEHY